MSRNPNYIQLGNTGPVGPQGPQGPQGLQGLQGLRGPIGQIGPRGQAGELAIDSSGTITVPPVGQFPTQTYGAAKVTNTGSSTNAILKFEIPAGLTGATGPTPILTIGDVSGVDPIGSGSSQVYGDATVSVIDDGTSNGAKKYKLNFGIPNGKTGPPISLGNVSTTTLVPGSDATVNLTAVEDVFTFEFGIPEGVKGDTGDIAAIASDLIPETDGLYNVGKSNAAGAGAYFKDGYFSGKFYLSDSTPETTNAIYRDGTTEGLVLESNGQPYKLPTNEAQANSVLKVGSTANTLEWGNQALISVNFVKTDANTATPETFPLFVKTNSSGTYQTPQINNNFKFDATNATLSATSFSGTNLTLGGTGTLTTGSGDVTFNGDVRVASNKTISFNGSTDTNEAIYGDGDYLYLKSNEKTFRMPNSIGDVGQALVINTKSGDDSTLSWETPDSGGGTADSASQIQVGVTGTDDEENLITFVSGGSPQAAGTKDLEMDSTLTFNPHTNTLSAINFSGSNLKLTNSDTITLTAANQNGDATLSIPDLGGTGGNIVVDNLSQTLTNKTLTTPQINDSSSDHQYVFASNELVANRTVTLPLLTGNDVFVFEDHAQTLTNKTLTSPVISTITNNSNTLTLPTTTDTLVGRDTTDTLTNKTLTTPQINDSSSDHQYVFASSELVANRTVTLPLLTGNDEFVFKDHAQTLTNKTLTAPKFGSAGKIDDANGNELIKFPATVGSATNEITISNAGTGSGPSISATGSADTNIDLNLIATGAGNINFTTNSNTGTLTFSAASKTLTVSETCTIDQNLASNQTVAFTGLTIGDGSNPGTITSNSTEDLVLQTNGGTNSGTITITDGANSNITLAPHGTGAVVLDADTVTVDGSIIKKTTVTTVSNSSNETYTATQLLGGLILRNPSGGVRDDDTETAANIVGAIPNAYIGSSFEFTIRNIGAETITLNAPGGGGGPTSGVTLSGTMTIAQNYSRTFLVVCDVVGTGSEEVTIYSLHYSEF